MANSAYQISISLTQFLVLLGLGNSENVSFIVPAANAGVAGVVTQVQFPVQPDSNDAGILLSSMEFDGVQSGLVGYDFWLGSNNIGGYAINAVPLFFDYVCNGAMQYKITNNQATPVAVNIRYLSLSRDVLQRDIMQALFALSAGGTFGNVQA